MELGRFEGISNEHYHSDTSAVSKSTLDTVADSAMHYEEAIRARAEGRQLVTEAMRFGTAFHTIVLEPEVFASKYVSMPKFDGRTNAGKADRLQFEKDFDGFETFPSEEVTDLENMRDVIMGNKTTSSLLTNGTAESTFVWDDPDTGIRCKCRTDFFNDHGIIVDLKMTASASAYDFSKSIADYRYHVQDAFYTDGVCAVTGLADLSFVFIAIEKKHPYKMSTYFLDSESKKKGHELYKRDLQKIKDIKNNGNMIQEITLPKWAL